MTDPPLWQRMYHDECYIELVRAVGYSRHPKNTTDALLSPLVDRFGKERVLAVFSDLTAYVFRGEQKRSGPEQDAEFCLIDEARKLAWQLLGPPPEKLEDFYRGAKAPPPLAPLKPASIPKKRTKKKGETPCA